MQPIKNTIIYLIGFAGSGKLTIAKEIQKLIPAILVDNHSINNLIFNLIENDRIKILPPEVWNKIHPIRLIVFETIKTLSNPESNFILTNELLDGKSFDQELFELVNQLAKDRHAKFLPVRLELSTEELLKRVVSEDRKVNLKHMDTKTTKQKTQTEKVFIPSIPYLNLNVTNLSAAESARKIVEELNKSS